MEFRLFCLRKSIFIFTSYMHENDENWVNGEDLKYEYVYFSKNGIRGKKLTVHDRVQSQAFKARRE